MKKILQRGFSFLMVLVICLSLLPALTITADAATVNYVKDGQYVYNWGTREETATFLSPMAEAFYEASNVTYAELAALSGSATTNSVPSSNLYKTLQSLMKGRQTYETSYNATRDLYMYTDCQESGSWENGKISSFYSGKAIGPQWDAGSTWNREHTWPNSKGDASGNGENDIMMLRPTATSENGSRGNKAYGEGGSYYHPNSESGGTHDLRGDVARIVLFVYTRWGNTVSMWGASGVIESKEVLLKWVEEDPVDTWELGRNDAVQSITGTRNVFVDYPELVFVMFGEEIPENMDTPSGNAVTCEHTDSYAVEAKAATCTEKGNTAGRYCNDCDRFFGGYTATNALGHSYTPVVTPPTATEQGYTTYTCSRCQDSYIANYTEALGEAYTVSFVVPTGVDALTNLDCGKAGIKLPTAGTPDGEYEYTFVGWTNAPVEAAETKPAFYAPGSTFKADADTTLYALYTYGVGGSGVAEYVLTNLADIQADDVVVITVKYQDTLYAMRNDKGATAAPTAVIVSVTGDKLSSAPADTLKWNMAGTNGTYIIYPNGTTSRWLYSTNNNNGIRVGTGEANTFSVVSGYLRNITYSRYMGVYRTNPDWRSYTSINSNISGETYGFYVETVAGTLYYSTLTAAACAHENTTTVTVDATCTVPGSVSVTCDNCGEVIATEVIDAPGHSYFYACDPVCMVCYELTNENAVHALVHVEAKAANCYETGNIEYWTCEYCGGCWDNENASGMPLNRMLVIVPATHNITYVEESCYNTEYWTCASCESYWADENLQIMTNSKNVIKAVATHELIHVAAVAPTCYAEGNVEHWYCTACETVWVDEALTQISNHKSVILPKAQATWYGANAELGGELALNFALDVSQLNGITGNYIVITRTYADGTTDTITIAQSEWVMDGNYVIVSYTGLAAKEMGDVITAVICDAEGNVISETKTDSIAAYAKRMLVKENVIANSEQRTLFVDMLNYGAAAQQYFGYNAENLVNADLTAEQASWASEAPAIADHRETSGCYYGSSLKLEENIYLLVAFNAAYEEGMKAVVSFTNHYGKLVEQELTVTASGSYVTVRVEGMAIADFSTMVSCTLYGANGTELGATADSVESYLARVNLGNLGDAIAKLGVSAYAFFHNA